VAASNLKGFYIGLGVIAVIGVGAIFYARAAAPAPGPRSVQEIPAADSTDTTTAPGYVLGSETAKLEIIEYADFECPACQQFAVLTMPDIRDRYINTGVVRWRFQDFPLYGLHKKTTFAHQGAACANEQGRFWEMHDQLYFNQGKWVPAGNSAKVVRELAKAAGVDLAKYDSCIDAGGFQKRIDASARRGNALGVGSTPTFIVNGQLIEAAQTFDAFKVIIENALKKPTT
jgi:protein-disulfide isomerase